MFSKINLGQSASVVEGRAVSQSSSHFHSSRSSYDHEFSRDFHRKSTKISKTLRSFSGVFSRNLSKLMNSLHTPKFCSTNNWTTSYGRSLLFGGCCRSHLFSCDLHVIYCFARVNLGTVQVQFSGQVRSSHGAML